MERLSCLQSIHGVEDSPYPHVFTEAALPEAIYAELEASFPEEQILDRVQQLDGGSPTRRLKTPEALAWSDLPPIWEDFLRFHTSAEYLQAVVRLFEPQLLRCIGPSRLQRLLNGSVAPRRMGGPSDLVTDCQFVLNDPVGGASTNQPPHVDNPKEIYAGLLYMRSPLDQAAGGEFTLHRLDQRIRRLDKAIGRQLSPALHTPLQSLPYRRNCFVMFLNTFGAVHSVTPAWIRWCVDAASTSSASSPVASGCGGSPSSTAVPPASGSLASWHGRAGGVRWAGGADSLGRINAQAPLVRSAFPGHHQHAQQLLGGSGMPAAAALRHRERGWNHEPAHGAAGDRS